MMFDFFRRKPTMDPETAARMPPGQYATEKWPVLHYGGVPSVPRDKWELCVDGLIEGEPLTLSFQELLALPLQPSRGAPGWYWLSAFPPR